ncbi:hypothetical protein D9M72_544760 [compost metagenome]
MNEHGAVHHGNIERILLRDFADVLEEVADVAGEYFLSVEADGPWAFQLGPLRIELIEVVRAVLDGPAEGELLDSHSAEPVCIDGTRVPGHLVATVIEPHRHARHGVEMAVNGLAGEQDLHGGAPESAVLKWPALHRIPGYPAICRLLARS